MWLADEATSRRKGTWIDPDAPLRTLEAWAREWIATNANLDTSTRDDYLHKLERWIAPHIEAEAGQGIAMGQRDITTITPLDVRRWHAQVREVARTSQLHRLRRESAFRPKPARVWAEANGYQVARSGRLPRDVVAAWEAAGSPDLTPPVAIDPVKAAHAGETATARAYSFLCTLMNAAVQYGLILKSPCALDGAGTPKHPRRPILTPEQVEAVAQAFPAPLYAAVILAGWSALREGEVFGLARRHIDVNAGTVRVERAVSKPSRRKPSRLSTPKTERSARTVHIPAFVMEALRRHLAAHVPLGPDALLFTLPSGGLMTADYLSRWMRKARPLTPYPDLHFHDLRHTGATLASENGATTAVVMQRLGHTTMRAALIYSHVSAQADKNVADAMDARYGSILAG